MLNPRYGALGLVVAPYYVVVELLAPVIEAIGVLAIAVGLATGAVNVAYAALFFLLAYGWGTALSLFALALDELTYRSYAGLRDRMVLFACALGEAVGYRQLTTVWRLRGLWNALRGRAEWGVMTRSGFSRGDARDGG